MKLNHYQTARIPASGLGFLCCVLITMLICISFGAGFSSASSMQIIALGDSLTQGTMDGTDNELNTANAYLQKTVDSLSTVLSLKYYSPFLGYEGRRLLPFQIPTYLGVDGSDIFSLEGYDYYKRAGTASSNLNSAYLCGTDYPFWFQDNYDKVMYPLNLVAGQPVSQLDAALTLLKQQAAAQDDSVALVLLWIGNNDSSLAALGMGGSNPAYLPIPFNAISSEITPGLRMFLEAGQARGLISFSPYTLQAIQRNLTDITDFTNQLNHILDRLHQENAMPENRTRILLLTLPYYSAVGYLFDSDDLEFYLQQVNPAYQVPQTFQRVTPPGQPITEPFKGDRVSLFTYAYMFALLQSGYSVDDVNSILEVNGVQQDGLVMSESEQNYIMSRIDSFNAAIRTAAQAYSNVYLVDIGTYLNNALSGAAPVTVGDKILSRKWSRGSTFSLDGVHPGYTGQALIANYLIGQINQIFQTDSPLIDLEQVLATDPYVDKDGDGWVPGPGYPATGLTELLFMFTDPDDSNPAVKAVLPSDFWQKSSRILLRTFIGKPALQQLADTIPPD